MSFVETKLLILVCDLDGQCSKNDYTSIEDIPVDDILNKISLAIPLDKLNYHIIAYKDQDTKYCLDLGIEFDLICKDYYNYAKTSCLETIPEGYFSNDNKTIDKCLAKHAKKVQMKAIIID